MATQGYQFPIGWGHVHMDSAPDVSGFSGEDTTPGETATIVFANIVTSESPDFHSIVEHVYTMFLSSYTLSQVLSNFLIIIHADKSADIYINDLRLIFQTRIKHDYELGAPVPRASVADVVDMRFDGVVIASTDKVIACLKAGWRFLLSFDLSGALDLAAFQRNIARVYRYLMFREEYAVLENHDLFETLLSEGWFPFSEMIGVDFRKLETAYRYADNPQKMEAYLADVHAGFTRERLDRLMAYWWRSPRLSAKKTMLSEAVAAYIEGKHVSCIKILYSEIEGVVRLQYHDETGRNPTFSELKQFISAKAQARSPDPGSLGFPAVFAAYLDRNIFANFDLDTGTVLLSRHSAEHGVADSAAYDKHKALQAILTLDQIRFYLF